LWSVQTAVALRKSDGIVVRVAVIWLHVGPYHVARLDALAARKEVEVLGIQLTASEAIRRWDPVGESKRWTLETLSYGEYSTGTRNQIARRLHKRLQEWQPDAVVVAGYAEPAMRFATRWARANGRGSILMSESHSRVGTRNGVFEGLKGWWIRRFFDAAFVSGERSTAYLEDLGFSRRRVWRGYSVVDNNHFAVEGERVRRSELFWREHLGLPGRYFLYVGRFAKEKNLDALIRAYEGYRRRSTAPWDLVLVGTGPEGIRLNKSVHDRRIAGIHWPGFKQIGELPRYYALANCFVLPSLREPWGLVINEAMASGLPVLASDRCGAVAELVVPGLNGYVFDPSDVGALSELMIRVTSDGVDLARMGSASQEIVRIFSPETWAAALSDCVTLTVTSKRQLL
jgi:glycosyltransferase involved in cell wall biosynthesis